jgi:thymidylate synthase (FAD)
MKIINQSYEILSDPDLRKQLKLIEVAGRTAYKSEDKITDDSAKEFALMITKRNHEAVLEHSFLSVKFITDRGVSHEIVRHRLCSFTQESTRYCNYSKDKFDNQLTFIRPVWIDEKVNGKWEGQYSPFKPNEEANFCWFMSILHSEQNYLHLIDTGWNPQQARSILPNSLKTEIVVSANFREWKHIFRLRAISKAAHPQMRDLMIPLYNYCKEQLPEIFDLGEAE